MPSQSSLPQIPGKRIAYLYTKEVAKAFSVCPGGEGLGDFMCAKCVSGKRAAQACFPHGEATGTGQEAKYA